MLIRFKETVSGVLDRLLMVWMDVALFEDEPLIVLNYLLHVSF
jgi:hypothetical protein